MTACFHLHPARVLNCGLPRNDWLAPDIRLPSDLAEAADRLAEMCGSRKLCLYAPTFRDEKREWSPMSRDQLVQLSQLLAAHGAVLGIRPHITVPETFFDNLPGCLDLSSSVFPEVQVALRHADMLITDYSSTSLDFMLMERPILSFAPDLSEYTRGYLYSFRDVFPGIVLESYSDLLDAVCKVYTDEEFRSDCVQIAGSVFHLFHEYGRKDISAKIVENIFLERSSGVVEVEG